jgi:hypothetical protein
VIRITIERERDSLYNFNGQNSLSSLLVCGIHEFQRLVFNAMIKLIQLCVIRYVFSNLITLSTNSAEEREKEGTERREEKENEKEREKKRERE